jgi:hypothetical protein
MKVIINGNIYLTDKAIGQVLSDDEYRMLRMLRAHNTSSDKRTKSFKHMIELLKSEPGRRVITCIDMKGSKHEIIVGKDEYLMDTLLNYEKQNNILIQKNTVKLK